MSAVLLRAQPEAQPPMPSDLSAPLSLTQLPVPPPTATRSGPSRVSAASINALISVIGS